MTDNRTLTEKIGGILDEARNLVDDADRYGQRAIQALEDAHLFSTAIQGSTTTPAQAAGAPEPAKFDPNTGEPLNDAARQARSANTQP